MMERVVAITALVLGFIILGMWWLETRFGAGMAFNVLMGITHLVAFAAGAVLSFAITRGSLRAVNEYAKTDAQVDRYRQQSFKEQARGDSAFKRAAAQMGVIDARRLDRLANDRAKAILQRDREAQRPVDSWSWDDQEDDDDSLATTGWE